MKLFTGGRVIPIFRTLLNMTGSAAFQFNNVPAPATVDQFGALWVSIANGGTNQQATQANTFSIFNTPAAATQATVTKAAPGAGKRNVLTNISYSVNAVAAQGVVGQIVVRDGASGVGAILWALTVGPFAAGTQGIFAHDVNIVGSVNTQMTIEFTAAPAATNFESVAGTGYIAGA